MKHTPGPWSVVRGPNGYSYLLAEHNAQLAILGGENMLADDSSAAANARLIASAPALLAALEACVCAMQDYQAGIGITELFDKGERMGRAAIAQATGDA